MKTKDAKTSRLGWFVWANVIALLVMTQAPARAVVFFSTADPEHNTSPPSAQLAGSGWQFEGDWVGFLGTAIAPRYFISAQHIGGAVGDSFVLGGVPYTTTAYFDDPSSDLRIWQVGGTFPVFAELYSRADEVGKALVVVGRGTQRGVEVTVSGLFGSSLKGWQWGPPDQRRRWGENTVSSTVPPAASFPPNQRKQGPLLRAAFDSGQGSNECALTGGDSGGGLFIKDGAVWKLAGISFAVDGPYNTTSTGEGFNAVIFDEGGLYKQNGDSWSQVPDLPGSQAGGFYATRISERRAWIESILSAPLPDLPVLQSSDSVTGPFQDEPSAVVDESQRTVRLTVGAASKLFRLRASSPLTIISINRDGAGIILRYQ